MRNPSCLLCLRLPFSQRFYESYSFHCFPSFLKLIVNPHAKEAVTVKSWSWRDWLLSEVFLEFDGLYLLQYKHIISSESCSMKTQCICFNHITRWRLECPYQLLLMLMLISAVPHLLGAASQLHLAYLKHRCANSTGLQLMTVHFYLWISLP